MKLILKLTACRTENHYKMGYKYKETIELLSKESERYQSIDGLLDLITQIDKSISWLKSREDINKCFLLLSQAREMLLSIPNSKKIVFKERIAAIRALLVDLLGFMQDQPLLGQKWYIDRMIAAGYNADVEGECYGMTFAAMTAFLSDDMPSFENRLALIHDTPVSLFENDFLELKRNQYELMEQGKIEEARKIQLDLVDILAFFDTLELIQSPFKYKYLLNSEEIIQGIEQEKRSFSPLIEPIIFKNQAIKPREVYTKVIGGYNKHELTTYFELLKSHLGKHSFSVQISCDFHAININYDAQRKCWIYLDPNDLPSQMYLNSSTMIEQFFKDKNVPGVTLGTTIWTQSQYVEEMHANFLNIKKSPTYQQLHNSEKEANGYEGYRDGEHMDILVTLGFLPTEKMMELLCTDQSVERVKFYQKKGACLTENMILMACTYHNFETAKFLLKQNIPDTQDLLSAFVIEGDITVVDFLIHQNYKSHEDALDLACFLGNLAMANFLIANGFKATKEMLDSACSNGNISIARLLIKNGVIPTSTMLDEAMSLGNKSMIELLKSAGITTENIILGSNLESLDTTSEESLSETCIKGNLTLAKQLIDRGELLTTEMLHKACLHANIPVIAFLIDHGLIPSKKMLGKLCVYFATRCYNSNIEETYNLKNIIIRLMKLTDLSDNTETLFESEKKAIEKFMEYLCNDKRAIPLIKFLVKKGAPATQEMLVNLLHIEEFDMCRFLISYGAQLTKDMLGLMCFCGRFSSAEFLIENGIKPDAIILDIMYEGGKESAVLFLLNMGVSPTQSRIKNSQPHLPTAIVTSSQESFKERYTQLIGDLNYPKPEDPMSYKP